jgi:ABC-type bacteriocin/lantibiotic exporter with double-glycine peptidase domain
MIENIETTIAKLDKKVSMFTKNEDTLLEKKSNFININSSMLVYVIAPILLLVIFMFSKPSFIIQEEVVDNVVINNKINTTKMLVIIIVISIPINFLLYKKFMSK